MMARARNRGWTALGAVALLVPLAAPAAAPAQQYSWDPTTSNGTALGGPGTWDLSTPNWFDGTKYFKWPNDSTAVFGGTASTVTVSGIVPNGVSAGGLTFNANCSIGGDPLNLSGSPPTVSLAAGVSAGVSSVLTGNAPLITGPGTLILSNGNAFSGTTTVTGGSTLQVANTLGAGSSATAAGPVMVNSGGTLTGTGSVAGPVGIDAGSRLSPGLNLIGTLSAGDNVTLTGKPGGAGSTWAVGINSGASGPAANLLNLTGATGVLNFVTGGAGTVNIDVEAVKGPTFTPGTPVTYTIATATAGINTNNGAFDPAGFTFSSSTIQATNYSLSASGRNLQLTFTPVPEPGRALLTGLFGLAGGWRLRRVVAGIRPYFLRT
jgi:autotransporter-associated beta strand protein